MEGSHRGFKFEPAIGSLVTQLKFNQISTRLSFNKILFNYWLLLQAVPKKRPGRH